MRNRLEKQLGLIRSKIIEKFLEKPERYTCAILLFIIFLCSLYLRAVPAHDGVFNAFSDVVRFGGNDPWYHMHLVKGMIYGGHYPQRLFFDAYTKFPYGTYIHFGPLQSLIIASFSLIAGFIFEGGIPSPYLIDTIGAYYPTILGALTIFPIYIIGKEVFNDRRVGILSAVLIAIMPGQFLSRSLLGFTDHHVAETLFSAATIAFMVLAMKSGKQVSFADVWNQNWEKLKLPVIYSVLAGIMYGSYLLSWAYGILIIFIILMFALVQYIIDHLRGNSTDYLGIMGMTMFIPPLLMVLPYANPKLGLDIRYSLLPPVAVILAFSSFAILSMLSVFTRKKGLKPYYYPIIVAVVGVLAVIGAMVLSPRFFDVITAPLRGFYRTGGGLTIAEGSPLLSRGIGMAYGNFAFGFFIAFIAFIILLYEIYKSWDAGKMLLLVWSLMILNITLAQNRFAYYYAANVAVLTGFVSWKVLEWGGFKSKEYGRKKIKKRGKVISSKNIYASRIKEYLTANHIMVAILVFFVVFYPPLFTPGSGSVYAARYSGGPNGEWYTTLLWMKDNTPSPGLEYYTIYEEPRVGRNYNISSYPKSAYGVISWWDYGHWIEIIGHRIPNSNPFQQGIGVLQCNSSECPWRGNPEKGPVVNTSFGPGAAPFFVEKNESIANKILDELGTRYVVSDIEMASGKFYAMAAWAHVNFSYLYDHYYQTVRTQQGYQSVHGPNYFKTMEGRLHILDGSEYSSGSMFIPALEHHRLVYESPGTSGFYTPDYSGGSYNYVKIFEYVKGANILVSAPENVSSASVSLNLTTDRGRMFKYVQSTDVDASGMFNFTVPYSTGGPAPTGTQFAVLAGGPYVITAGNITRTVQVTEDQVMNGETIYIDMRQSI